MSRICSLICLLCLLSISSCTFLEFPSNDGGSIGGDVQIMVTVVDGIKNGIVIEETDIVQATLTLIDPVSNVQTRNWNLTNTNVFFFTSTLTGSHTFKLTDIDNASNTNVATAILYLKRGYNYKIIATIGGSIQLVETSDVAYDPGLGWNMVWHDEFDTPLLDTSFWAYDIGTGPNNDGWGNGELEYYTSRTNNIRIEYDNLVIRAQQESYGGKAYTSARIKTKDKICWQYGKIVARIKLPYGKGLWPAFWMLGTNYNNANWPNCGEMDILEMVGGTNGADSTIYGSLFWYNSGTVSFQRSTNTLAALSQDYHVYEIEWNSAYVVIRVDKKDYFYYDISSSVYDLFRQPFFILLNVAVGGLWPGSPDGMTVFPQTMYVDWVRVYQKDPNVPSLNISYPQNNTTLYGQFPVRGTVEGSNAVQSVYLSVDGGAYTLISSATPFSYNLNLSAGAHNLKTYAKDVSNKNSVTNDLNITVTLTKPVVTFTYMPAEASSEQVRGLLTGVSPSMYRISLQIFTYWLGWWVKPTSAAPFTPIQGDGSWNAVYVTGGVDSLARAMKAYVVPAYIDETANIISNSVAAVFTNRVDNHMNTAYVVDPNSKPPYAQKFNDFTNGSTVYTTNSNVSFTGWAVDSSPDGAVNFVTISLDGGPYTNTNYIGSYYQEWNMSRTFAPGAHTLSVYKKDNGFGIQSTNTMNFTVIVDSTKPTVSPTSSNFTGSSVTINGTASDNIAVKKVCVNWYLWHDYGSGPAWYNYGTQQATGTNSWSLTYNTGYTGTNLLEIYSVDLAGNESVRVTNRVYTY